MNEQFPSLLQSSEDARRVRDAVPEPRMVKLSPQRVAELDAMASKTKPVTDQEQEKV